MGVMGVRRLSLAVVVSLCGFVGGLSFSVSVALAVSPPVVEETGVLDVAGTSATFEAKIDPQGSETAYRFEYGTSEAYGSSIPVPDGLVGSGTVGVTVSAHPQNLSASTTYHFRVLALVASRSETVAGGDGTFTTQPAGGEFALPDARQWELVSPPNKHGAQIRSLSNQLNPIQASADGGGITYDTNVPTEQGAQGYTGKEQVLSERGAEGWSSRDISPPHSSFAGVPAEFDEEYFLFTSDLSSSLVSPEGEDMALGAGSTLLSDRASEPTPYVRRESLCDAPASASECYLPVLTGKEGFADVPPGTKFGFEPGYGSLVNISGASPDMRHVVVLSRPVLTATPNPGYVELYEWSAGVPAGEALQLVSVLPESEGGGPVQRDPTVGELLQHPPGAAGHAISDDGSRIVWVLIVGNGGYAIYVRDTAKQETVRLDVPQPGVPSGGEPAAGFMIASSDGSRVFFTDEQGLTAQSSGKDLYECQIVEEAGKLKCDLTDLSPAAEVQGVVGASEDGSYVYFAANTNLYEYHDGATTFITTLSTEDRLDSVGQAARTARVSPNGRYVAFMSARSLTGYDNRDAVSGKPDMEVYLYDSVSKRLACASCNPTGSRPIGVEVIDFDTVFGKPAHFQNLVGVVGAPADAYGPESWVAANLPGGVNLASASSLYQPRALSDSGRVFFNSNDGLVPQDVNGQEDVYEFEPEGAGGCTGGSVSFSAGSGGCVGLVSSGASPAESGFMDASETGGDVFFLTSSRLTSQDYDTGLDVYDAHECSVSVPCVAQPVAAPPCSSGDSCKAASSPQPSVFGAPPSATFAGAGNVVASPATNVVRAKSLTRAQKLARALRACGKKPKRKRTACGKQARKRYGARGARRATKATGKGQG
jgi:hypothetical protein